MEVILRNAISRGEIRSDINVEVVALQYFSLSIGLAGDLIRTSSVGSAIKSLKNQLNQLYYLLKITYRSFSMLHTSRSVFNKVNNKKNS